VLFEHNGLLLLQETIDQGKTERVTSHALEKFFWCYFCWEVHMHL
jgi:hypothetical protein